MDFSTLVDLDDFFGDAVGGAANDALSDAFGLEDIVIEEAGYSSPYLEETPLPEYRPIEYESLSYEDPQLSEVRVEQLRSEIQRASQGGKDGFMDFWKKLSDKDKDLLFRTTMGVVGGGAREAIRSVQQSRAQEFQREMTNLEYAERRAREQREAEASRVSGTPQAMAFNVQPRGIIRQGMGG